MNMKAASARQCVKGNMGELFLLGHKSLYAALGFSLCMFAPGLASAAWVQIDDLTDNIYVTTDQHADIQITHEAIGVLGAADIHFEFMSADPNRPLPGSSYILNYNIFGPHPEGMSDTLSISVTGHTSTGAADFNNVSVDMHFRSDSKDEIPPPVLLNAANIIETGAYQVVGSGLSDLKVEFRSDVSEVPVPAAAWLLGSGLLGLFGVARRK